MGVMDVIKSQFSVEMPMWLVGAAMTGGSGSDCWDERKANLVLIQA